MYHPHPMSEKALAEPPTLPLEAEASTDPITQLEAMGRSLAKLSTKDTGRLIELRTRFNHLRKSAGDECEGFQKAASAFYEDLGGKLASNREYQEQLQEATLALLEDLKKALKEGRAKDALPAWDRIQGNISNTGGKIREELQRRAEKLHNRIHVMRNWKAFAATEKKKELVEQMRRLTEVKMEPLALSRSIKKMHQEWKRLGRAVKDDKLWKQFKELSDAAFEPTKPFFAERKRVMAENLEKREELCKRLEEALTQPSPDAIEPNELHKLITSSEREWKQHAPVSASDIKSIKKRFYDSLNRLRGMRSDNLKESGIRKQELVSKAEALAALDDNKRAMDEAKKLQQEWKKLGPAPPRDDQKLWDAFRGTCDRIFAELNAARSEKQALVERHGSELEGMLEKLEPLTTLEGEALREQRGAFRDLIRAFTEINSPDLRRAHKRQVERFNTLQRQIEQRFRGLPDKKKLLLKQAVEGVTALLEPVEQALLGCKDEAGVEAKKQPLADIKKSLTEDESLGKNPRYQKILLERLERVTEAAAPADLEALATAADESLHRLCVQLEIRAEMDSPEEDQPLRMQLQLERLQEGLGQGQEDTEQNGEAAFEAELEALCTGPLAAKRRKNLRGRLDEIVKRLR